ncbi:MAG: energy transducer TonB, partial [Acidobacteria bacterium]|nr:energy transducer TonB [Acidobacteriota bacterium]
MSRFKTYVACACLSLLSLLALNPAEQTKAAPTSLRQEQAQWERYRTLDEEFSVLMPELPGVYQSMKCLDGPLCQLQRIDTTYSAYSDGVVYLVISYKTPHSPSLEDIISERLSPDVSASITFQSEVKLNKFKGRKIIYTAKPYGYDIVTGFYATKEHVYEVSAVGGSRTDAAIKKFFESFELGGRKGTEIGEGARLSDAATPAPVTPKKNEVAGGIQATQIYKPNEVTRKAIIVVKPSPEYTEEARRNSVTGKVTLQMIFNSSGRVTNIHTVSGLPYGLTEN